MARCVILVEGESDKAALEAAARVRGDDLADLSILVMGGATNMVRFLRESVAQGLRTAGLYDTGERAHVVRAAFQAGLTDRRDPGALERLGFFVCDPDLEGELIAAVGADRILEIVADQSEDGRRFRKLAGQPEWRERPVEEQLRRWFGSGGSRKVRYATLLVAALPPGSLPTPLAAVLDHALGRR